MSISNEKSNRIKGTVAMFITTMIWGAGFVVMKDAMDSIPWAYALAYRLTGATIVLALIGIKSFKHMNKKLLINGTIIGVILFAGYGLQVCGLQYTTVGKSAFLTVTYCVTTPFLCWIVYKKRPDRYNFIAAAVCITGIGFISLQGGLSIGIGDVLTLMCGLAFAIQIVAIDKMAKDGDIVLYGIIQTGASAVCSWICAPILHGAPSPIPADAIWQLAYLCIMATGVAFAVQLYGQKRIPATSTSLILSMESVMGTIFSVIFLGEKLNVRIIIGFSLVFLAIVISETKLSFLSKKKRKTAVEICDRACCAEGMEDK